LVNPSAARGTRQEGGHQHDLPQVVSIRRVPFQLTRLGEKLALGLSTPKRVAAGGTGGEDTAGDQSDTPETPTKPKKVAAPRTPRKKPEPKLDEDGNPIPTPKRVRKKPEPKLDEDGNPIPTPKRKRASPQKKAAVKSEEAVGTDEEEDTNMESPTKKAKADESDETAGNDDEGAISGEAIAQEFGITGEDGDGVAA
jgi:hypothetical protein